jgi:hypothetical protein
MVPFVGAMYKCTKCGETADSKCVNQRSVFSTDQTASLIRQLMTFKFKTTREVKASPENGLDEDYVQRELIMDFTVNGSKMDDVEDLKRCLELLSNRSDDTLRKVMCKHEWRITSGKCMFGCCVAEEQP